MTSALLIFLKFPRIGRVKTRLARGIGDRAAVLVYHRLVRDVLEMVAASPADSVQIWFDPPEKADAVRKWIEELQPAAAPRWAFHPQAAGDLGTRLRTAFASAFSEGYEKIAAIGTDCVEIVPEVFTEVWRTLDDHDAVFGPTPDGGYYLLGLSRLEPALFDVTWSSETTLSESLEQAARTGMRTHLLPPLPDIDTVEEWTAEKRRIFAMSDATLTEPITFEPIYQTRVWGGRTLQTRFKRPLPGDQPIGESWEVVDREEAGSLVREGNFAGMSLGDLWTGHREAVFGLDPSLPGRFPLLLKILDARDDLSLQVHPSEEAATRLGGEPKTEMWYVAHADPGAKLYAGLKTGVTPERFRAALEEGTAEELLHVIEPRTSDVLFIPSGRIHAIGAGLVIYEIQENSDTTYRVYDWNRMGLEGKPRDLHIDEALQSIDFNDVAPAPVAPNGETLVSCRQFEVARWDLGPAESRRMEDGRFALVTVLHGPVRSGSVTFETGECFLIPAGGDLGVQSGSGGASVLCSTLPRGWVPRQMRKTAAAEGSPDGDPHGAAPDGEHEGFYRGLRAKIVEWAETRTDQDNPWLRYILLAPDFFHLLCALAADPGVDRKSKVMLAGVIAYFVVPFDLIPEGLLGPVGYLDDLALAAFALNRIVNETDASLLRKHWAGDGDVLELVQELVEKADEMIGSGLVKKVREKLGV